MQDMGGAACRSPAIRFDSETVLERRGCSCGRHKSQGDHDAAQPGEEQLWRRAVEGAVVRAMFPSDMRRRAFMKAVGSATALAAISEFFPLGTGHGSIRGQLGSLEKPVSASGLYPHHLRYAAGAGRTRWAFMPSTG